MLIAPTATRVEFGNITPVRLGDAARQMPDHVVIELERAAIAHGVTPWLVHGSGGQLANSQTIDAFGLPTVTTPSLRRGPVATLVRHRGTDDGLWQPWRLASRSEYAQVASDGQSLGWLEGDRDPDRPFRLTGALADRDIVSLVAFIRASPVGPGPGGTRVRGQWPILLMSRQTGGAIDVVLRAGDLPGQRVTVRSQNGAWVVIGLS